MASFDKKFASHRMGPGGLNCPCCGPAPGKGRRQFLRAAKHAAHNIIAREIEADVRDLDEDFDWQQ
jgi:hypothetical protein